MGFLYKITGFSLFILALSGCDFYQKNKGKPVTIDFSDQNQENAGLAEKDAASTLKVAVSAIISPRETFDYYEELFHYISAKTGYEIEFKQRKTYEEVNLMLKDLEVDLAFICSGAYADGKETSDMEILAIPVCEGKSSYQAYVIANRSSTIEHFEDLENKIFAHTDPMSHTGKLYADMRVKKLDRPPEDFFSKSIYSHGHDISMQLVSKQVVDGASVNGLIYNYIEKTYPERVANIKIIEKSEYYGMPPVVMPAGISDEKKETLRELITSMHLDPEGKSILNKLLIDRFIPGNDDDYNRIREMITFVGS